MIPLVADKQLPTGDWPMPIAPQEWHYRQSIDYEMTNNRAIVDYASRYRETFLYNIYAWARTPSRKAARITGPSLPSASRPWKPRRRRNRRRSRGWWRRRGRGGRGGAAAPAAPAGDAGRAGDVAGAGGGGGFGGRGGLPADLYNKVLHDPKLRDPRGYILPSDQADFANAVEFLNALSKTGVDVQRATASFTVAGKNYPAGSYIVKTAQAFRPHVLDMFEPQDHPNDFRYPGGPPNPPYDITGWTLAIQMGVQVRSHPGRFRRPLPEDRLQPAAASRHDRQRSGQPRGLSHQPRDQQLVQDHQPPAEGQCRRLLDEECSHGRWQESWSLAPSGFPHLRRSRPSSIRAPKNSAYRLSRWPKPRRRCPQAEADPHRPRRQLWRQHALRLDPMALRTIRLPLPGGLSPRARCGRSTQ